MNSQQELLDAINTITKKKDRSFDTPATVLRVDGGTVWVHIDGGADETPVAKTINCEEGETVQVRISNGRAFLVGNASAPPTDDKTANEARFVAEDADDKATKAIRSVGVIEQTVEGKVSSGSSGVHVLSSTMLQNANGVNIYNNSLAVGDSYAHIDEDEFCLREVTSAGIIDESDFVLASFGKTSSFLHSYDSANDALRYLEMDTGKIRLGLLEGTDPNNPGIDNGWQLDGETLSAYGPTSELFRIIGNPPSVILSNAIAGEFVSITTSDISMSGDVLDEYGNKKTPTILEALYISASDTSYTFLDSRIKADSVIDIYDSIFGFAPTGCAASTGTCTVTFPAQSSSHSMKIFIY